MSVETSKKALLEPGFRAGPDLGAYVKGPGGEAWALIAQLFFDYGRPKMMNAGQELELSPPQGIVLRFLDEPRPMGELAALMRCDNSNLTGIVDRLEDRGLVRRTAAEGDRRVKLIALTEQGRELREQLNRRMAEPPEPIEGLSAEDQRALRDILRRALAE
jgi:MarR family transcriptional regulator, organic hydroperoxide resistance regulator